MDCSKECPEEGGPSPANSVVMLLKNSRIRSKESIRLTKFSKMDSIDECPEISEPSCTEKSMLLVLKGTGICSKEIVIECSDSFEFLEDVEETVTEEPSMASPSLILSNAYFHFLKSFSDLTRMKLELHGNYFEAFAGKTLDFPNVNLLLLSCAQFLDLKGLESMRAPKLEELIVKMTNPCDPKDTVWGKVLPFLILNGESLNRVVIFSMPTTCTQFAHFLCSSTCLIIASCCMTCNLLKNFLADRLECLTMVRLKNCPNCDIIKLIKEKAKKICVLDTDIGFILAMEKDTVFPTVQHIRISLEYLPIKEDLDKICSMFPNSEVYDGNTNWNCTNKDADDTWMFEC